MPLMLSCPWCGTLNHIALAEDNQCSSCGHRCDKPRQQCTCQRCAACVRPNTTDLMRVAAAFTRVSGRGVHSPVLTWTCSPMGACLRVDDELNPELWLQIELSPDALNMLVAYTAATARSAAANTTQKET